MVKVRCPSCSKTLNAPDKFAGKRIKCPACQGTVVIPELVEEILEAEEVPEAVTPLKPRKPALKRDLDEDEDRIAQKPARRARTVDDDEDDDRPRRKKRRKLTRGEWADCPNCGCNEATRVHWTMWGGVIGPLIINTVRCHECGTNYNGVHGDYNTTRVTVFVLINLGLGLAGVVIGVAVSMMNL